MCVGKIQTLNTQREKIHGSRTKAKNTDKNFTFYEGIHENPKTM